MDEVGRGGALGDLGLGLLTMETLPVFLHGVLLLLKNVGQVAAIVAPLLIPTRDFGTQHLVLLFEHLELLDVVALDVGELLVKGFNLNPIELQIVQLSLQDVRFVFQVVSLGQHILFVVDQ